MILLYVYLSDKSAINFFYTGSHNTSITFLQNCSITYSFRTLKNNSSSPNSKPAITSLTCLTNLSRQPGRFVYMN